jgi:hypothetical protein
LSGIAAGRVATFFVGAGSGAAPLTAVPTALGAACAGMPALSTPASMRTLIKPTRIGYVDRLVTM